MTINDVIYVQCPHCKKGWYGKILSEDISLIDEETGAGYAHSVYVEGITPTDLTRELTCLNCGGKYTPIEKVIIDTDRGTWKACSKDNVTVLKTWDFVAELITKCKGK